MRHFPFFLWIPDDEVGIGSDGQRSFLRVQAEELGRVGRDELYESAHRNQLLCDALGKHQGQAGLDAGNDEANRASLHDI